MLDNFIDLVFDRHLPVTKEECQKKLKEEFLKNKHITDVRVIDMLVIKVCKNYFDTMKLLKLPRIEILLLTLFKICLYVFHQNQINYVIYYMNNIQI